MKLSKGPLENKHLHIFESFQNFKDSDLLQVWKEFIPSNKVKFTVTDELIQKYGEMFQDLFAPHTKIVKWSRSILSDVLDQEPWKETRMLHGMWTLSFLTWRVRWIFAFKDNTEIIVPRLDNVIWTKPVPSWSKMSAIFRIKEVNTEKTLKINDKTYNAVEVVFAIIENSHLVEVPVMVAEWTINYIEHKDWWEKNNYRYTSTRSTIQTLIYNTLQRFWKFIK